jgi:histidinol-phosphatase (PHP family)
MQTPVIDTTVDGHVHTSLCHHARGDMEEYVVAAVNRGLRRLIFLEHLEVGIDYFESTWLTEEDFNFYHREGHRLREKYRDRIEIGLGVEVGYNPRFLNEIQRRLALHTWDRIGISYHFLESAAGHLNMVSRKQINIDRLEDFGLHDVISLYYNGLREAVEKLPGQVLCHIDAVLRHHPNVVFSPEHHALIDTLLDAAARKKMAIEINTSGYKTKGQPFPSLLILKKATVRNIPLVAGSDAHRPEDVGRYFERLPGLMQELAGSNQSAVSRQKT